MDIRILSKKFLDFENKNKLFQKKIGPFFYWDYIRYFIHVDLSIALNPSRASYIYQKRPFKKKIIRNFTEIIKLIFSVIKNSALLIRYIISKKHYDIMFLCAGGRTTSHDMSYNRYCYFHLKELSKKKEILVIETEIHNDKSFIEIGCDYICIPLKFVKILSIFTGLKRKHINEIANINKLIIDTFDFEIDIKSIFKNYLIPQFLLFKILTFIIKRNKPKSMGFINDGNSKYFNNVASEMKIPSFEFQHGDTSNLSMVSTYSENISGEFFVPDTMFLFGEYWKDRYNTKSNKIVIGNPSFEFHKNKAASIKQNLNQVLCISVNSLDFGKLIFSASQKDKRNQYLFKLRDSEFSNWKKNYPFFKNTENFKIIDNNSQDLYSLIKNSKYVITTISTVIYEALSLRRNVIVIKDSDFPFVEKLHEKEFIDAVVNEEQLINKINQPIFNLDVNEIFFKKNFSKNISNEINKFI